MYIKIKADQIYNIVNNNKIISNIIKGIDIGEGIFKLTPDSSVWQESVPQNAQISSPQRYYTKWTTIVGDRFQRAVYDVYLGEIERESDIEAQIIENTYYGKLNYTTGINNKNDNISFPYIPISDEIEMINDYDLDLFSQIFTDCSTTEIKSYESLYRYASQQFGHAKYVFNYTYGNPFSLKIQYVYKIIVYWQESEGAELDEYGEAMLSNSTFSIFATEYGITENDKQYGESPLFSIDSNELIQTTTYKDMPTQPISQYIYKQIKNNWEQGKETATIKCSIGEYYDDNGNLVISTKNNELPMLFNIKDKVIPYIAVANGGTEPLSKKLNGNPKIFKITQIRPYFDGAFWQELQLQEQTTDQYIENVIFTSGTDGNATAGYIAQNQTVVVTKGKIIDVELNYSTESINTVQVSPTVSINEADNSFTIANVNLVSPNSTANIYATVIHEI